MEFKRSRIQRIEDREITRKTILLGFFTIIIFIFVIIFGIPFLVKFAVFLGESKNLNSRDQEEVGLPPLAPRMVLPFEATNSAQIVISGLAEPGIKVELLKNDAIVTEGQVSGEGDFVFENIDLEKGENEFNARAVRENGQSSELSAGLLVVLDEEAPAFELINPSESELKVDYADFDIVGRSEKGVSVTVNNRLVVVEDDGSFKLKLQLTSGKNEIEVIVRDLAGNESRKKITITYEN